MKLMRGKNMNNIYEGVVSNMKSEKEAISCYILALQTEPHTSLYWEDLDQAIIKRWSKSGLMRIKKQAWKILKMD